MVLYTIPELARMLGIESEAAYALARRGEVPTVRIGASVRVPASALAERLGVGMEELPTLLGDVQIPVGFLSARDVAGVLRVSPSTVTRALQRSELDGRRVGGRWYVRSASLAALLGISDEAVVAAAEASRRSVSTEETDDGR